MFGPRRGVCALAVGLLFLAGCTREFIQQALKGDEAAFVGVAVLASVADGRQLFEWSVAYNAQQLERALKKLGLAVTVENQGDTVRIKSTTKDGQRFLLVLTTVPEPGKTEGCTHITVEWEGRTGGHVNLHLLGDLVVPNKPAGAK